MRHFQLITALSAKRPHHTSTLGMRTHRILRGRHGAAAVLAMLFLVLFATLSVAMLSLAVTNTQGARNLSDVARAQDAAESGLRFMQHRFVKMQRPKTTIGNITASVAATLWPSLQTAISNDFAAATVNGQTNWNQMQTPSERVWTIGSNSMSSAVITPDDSGATFVLTIAKHPLYVGDPLDARHVRVTSTGTYRTAVRSVSMDFKLDKKIKFAVVGKVPIQIGRNSIVEGNIGMATTTKFPPFQMLTDFRHFDPTLSAKINTFEDFLEANHVGYDGRISINNTAEYTAAQSAGYTDYNTDGYVDEYDLFLKEYDSNSDRKLTRAEFTKPSTGQVYDENLFTLIDNLNAPLFAGDVVRDGLNDGLVDNRDGYAKVRGNVSFAMTSAAWISNLTANGQTIWDWMDGPVAPPERNVAPVRFGVPVTEMLDLNPANFNDCAEGFRSQVSSATAMTAVPAAGSVVTGKIIDASHANGPNGNGTGVRTVDERTPFGSTSYQATYRRPIYKNVTFRNCVIKKGTNALFDGCTFEGVTFVDMEGTITTSSGSSTTSQTEGMNWSKRRVSGDSTFSNAKILLGSGTASSGQMITKGSQLGNNVRFHNCSFNGPVAGTAATAYTHFSNSWEFTGSTLFDNQVDETATIVAPNTNIEMGSFTNPNAAPSTLKGVVVAGNIDIRGTSLVDGSIIVTGDGAGNTTLSYFGPSDGDTNPSAMPEGGFGRLDIRYNPHRALPDGINIAIDVLPDSDTYREGLNVNQ